MKRTLILSVCIALMGCTSLDAARRADSAALVVGEGLTPPTAAECRAWDDKRMAWGTVGTVAGVLSGGGGAVATLTPLAKDDGARLALGLTSLVLAGAAAASGYMTETLTTRYVTQCTSPAP